MRASERQMIELHNTAARLGTGDGVKRDLTKSRQMYSQALRLGSIKAAYELGMSYLCDKPRSIEKGLGLLRRAARGSVVDAQQLLGDTYAQGLFGQRRNRRTALGWYKKAAAQGDRRAKAALKELRRS